MCARKTRSPSSTAAGGTTSTPKNAGADSRRRRSATAAARREPWARPRTWPRRRRHRAVRRARESSGLMTVEWDHDEGEPIEQLEAGLEERRATASRSGARSCAPKASSPGSATTGRACACAGRPGPTTARTGPPARPADRHDRCLSRRCSSVVRARIARPTWPTRSPRVASTGWSRISAGTPGSPGFIFGSESTSTPLP